MLRTVTLLALYSLSVFVRLLLFVLHFHFLFIFFSFACLYCGKNHLSYYTVGCRRQEYKPLVLCFLISVACRCSHRHSALVGAVRPELHSPALSLCAMYIPPVRLVFC